MTENKTELLPDVIYIHGDFTRTNDEEIHYSANCGTYPIGVRYTRATIAPSDVNDINVVEIALDELHSVAQLSANCKEDLSKHYYNLYETLRAALQQPDDAELVKSLEAECNEVIAIDGNDGDSFEAGKCSTARMVLSIIAKHKAKVQG